MSLFGSCRRVQVGRSPGPGRASRLCGFPRRRLSDPGPTAVPAAIRLPSICGTDLQPGRPPHVEPPMGKVFLCCLLVLLTPVDDAWARATPQPNDDAWAAENNDYLPRTADDLAPV